MERQPHGSLNQFVAMNILPTEYLEEKERGIRCANDYYAHPPITTRQLTIQTIELFQSINPHFKQN